MRYLLLIALATAAAGCSVCDLMDQLTNGPYATYAYDNLADSCTPVPGNCP